MPRIPKFQIIERRTGGVLLLAEKALDAKRAVADLNRAAGFTKFAYESINSQPKPQKELP